MAAEPSSETAFRVGDWRVEPAWHRLSRRGDMVKLEPRVMRLLTTLSASPGQPLSREQLLDTIWPDLHVNEDALSRAVSQLRRALGDDPKAPVYIETVHKGGYCLIAPVRAETARTSGPRGPAFRRFILPVLIGVALILLAGLWLGLDRGPPAVSADPELAPIPLTSAPGREIDPAISRDGTRFAFGGSSETGYDLFWRRTDGGQTIRLTRNGRFIGHPVWSRDGTRLAYLSTDGRTTAVHIRELATGRDEAVVRLTSWSGGLDWSPDGRMLVVSDGGPDGSRGLFLFDLATGTRRDLTRSRSPRGDSSPAFAPDGRHLAFARDAGLGLDRLFVIRLEDPDVLREVGAPERITGLDWAPDGQSLIYSAASGGSAGLWRIGLAGGAPSQIRSQGGDLFNPSVAADGRLVAEAVERDSDIWASAIGQGGGGPLIRSTFDDHGAVTSPDGRRIAFISARSGSPQLWVAAANGADPVQLSHFSDAELDNIVWAQDGARLALAVRRRGYGRTFLIDLRDRTTRPVEMAGEGHQLPLGWADPNRLVIASGTGFSWTVRRHDLQSGRTDSVSTNTARAAALSPDGRLLELVTDGSRLIRIDLVTGRTQAVALPHVLATATGLQRVGQNLYLFVHEQGGTRIYRREDQSGAVSQLAQLPTFRPLTISPDQRSALFTRDVETANDIVLLRL